MTPSFSTPVFSVRDFGASGDGTSFDTEALQGAIDACHRRGGGTVLVSPGTYLTRPLYLRSHVELHLEKGATLLGSADPADYVNWESDKMRSEYAPYNSKALLMAEDEEEIAITGEGTIDGQGDAHYDTSVPEGSWMPIIDKKTRPGRMIMFLLCRNVRIEGIHCVASPAWTFWVFGCEKVRFHGVTIETNLRAINTDGIDIDACREVVISHCNIRTGDDAIILRNIERVFRTDRTDPGVTGLGMGPMACEQVLVENCTLLSLCNAIRLSYINDGVIRNATFRNISIAGSRRGIICQVPTRAMTPEGKLNPHSPPRPSSRELVVENITFSNITVEAYQPIWFFLANEQEHAERIGNITFENLTLVGGNASVFKGNAKVPMSRLVLRNIQCRLRPTQVMPKTELNAPAAAFHFVHCRSVALANLAFEGNLETGEEMPLLNWEEVEGVDAGSFLNATPYALAIPDTEPSVV